MLIQQGDVLIESCSEIPSGAKKVNPTAKGIVLAEGEVTGHSHRITVAEIENVGGIKFLEKDGMYYLQNKKPVKVIHEEHSFRDTIRNFRSYNAIPEMYQDYITDVLGIEINQFVPFQTFVKSLPSEIVVPAGIHRVRRVREYDHFDNEAREVAD